MFWFGSFPLLGSLLNNSLYLFMYPTSICIYFMWGYALDKKKTPTKLIALFYVSVCPSLLCKIPSFKTIFLAWCGLQAPFIYDSKFLSIFFALQTPKGVDTATLLCNMSDIICISEKLLSLLETSVKYVEFEKQIIGKAQFWFFFIK